MIEIYTSGVNMKKIAVLIPCYNEASSIAKVVTDFKTALPDATVYVFDNNSTDNSVQLAKEAGAIVKKETRQGKGWVVRSMFKTVDADCYVMVDGDDTYPAKDAPEMVKAVLEDDYDMVIGDRLSNGTYQSENKRKFHEFGNYLVRKLINLMFRSDLKDIMSGYRAFSKKFVKLMPVMSDGFQIETEMSVHALVYRFKLKEIPITYKDRGENSESKLDTIKDGFKVIVTILDLLKGYRPFFFFFVLAMIIFIPSVISLLITSLNLFSGPLQSYYAQGFEQFLKTILSGVISAEFILQFIVVCVLITMGIILDAIKNQTKLFYEMKCNAFEEKCCEVSDECL